MQYSVSTTYDSNGQPLMTTLFRHVLEEFGVERQVLVAFPGWETTDRAVKLASKLGYI